MRVAIVGAGAVGLGVGSCLLAAGARVELVVRSAGARAELARRGLSRSGLFGARHDPPDRFGVHADIADCKGLTLDALIVAVKTTATRSVAGDLARSWRDLPGGPAVVSFQNGWGNAEILADAVPAERVFSARVITGFQRESPSAVEITVHAEPIRLGSLFGADEAELSPLCAAIARGGIPCELSPEIGRDLWAKLLYNCALNPLGALRGLRYGELANREADRAILHEVVHEIFDVMRAAGHETHWPSAEAYLRAFHDRILPPTAEHESSMLHDLRAGRATEIDALCGAVAELGARHGVATPVNAALRTLVRASEVRGLSGP